MQNQTSVKNTNFPKCKTKSRISKRSRNRRRNRQKLQNAIQNKAPCNSSSAANAPNAPNTPSASNASNVPSGQNSQLVGAEMWRDTYENAVRWHGEHQSNYWRGAVENLQKENEMLRQRLEQSVSVATTSQPDVYYETSEEDEEHESKKILSVKREEIAVGDDKVDVEYLEFLRITFKHREELRRKRQAEALEAAESPTAGPSEPQPLT